MKCHDSNKCSNKTLMLSWWWYRDPTTGFRRFPNGFYSTSTVSFVDDDDAGSITSTKKFKFRSSTVDRYWLLAFIYCIILQTTLLSVIQISSAQIQLACGGTGGVAKDQAITTVLNASRLSRREPAHYSVLQNDKGNGTKPIIIGYLTNFYGRHSSNRQGLVISGAISYAIDYINNERKELLNGRQLRLIYNDTSATSINGTAAVIWQWRSGAVAFFGPEDTCEVEATIAGALNLPMISYKCANSAVSNKEFFPTFARTHPPDVIVVRSVLALLQYYQWKKFGIVWYERSQKFLPVVSMLRTLAKDDFEITVDYPFDNENECCIHQRECCGRIWYELVEKTYRRTRIYVFLGGASILPHFLLALKLRGLLDNGDYIVISVELDEEYSEHHSHGFLTQRIDLPEHELHAISEAARSLLIITRSLPESPNYVHFVEKVRQYNKLPPFCLRDHMDLKRHITYYASYLYDAVILYAEALAQVFSEGSDEYDGKKIIQKIIARQRYQSITGAWMYIDQNGDVQGNYTVLQPIIVGHQPPSKRSLDDSSFSGMPSRPTLTMRPVGSFQYDQFGKKISFKPSNPIQWFRPGHVPLDEPPCGFDDSGCDTSRDARIREIFTAILLAIFVAIIIITMITYRGWKTEQEIDGLLWKINRDGVIVEHKRKPVSSSSCDSLTMVDVCEKTSNDSDAFSNKEDDYEIHYRGVLVSFKLLKFSNVKKNALADPFDYLTRENKMEMKWLKEMHHPNVNVFIGATTHSAFPSCVLLLSEYFAKGSLRDVLENEEIRLDEGFLSSLVQDIVNGLSYLHKSDLKCHGNLKSTNCLVTNRFVVKLNDFGLFSFRREDPDPQIALYNKLWTAPETLRHPMIREPEGDMYSFGIILHEIFVRKGPYAIKLIPDDILFDEMQKIVDEVKLGRTETGHLRRPDTTVQDMNDEIIDMMSSCWADDPRSRPTVESFKVRLKTCQKFKPPPENMVENMVKMMEVYQNQLEDLVFKRTQQLDEEKKKTETLLYQMLPESVARQLISGQAVIPEAYEGVTIFFSDIVGFTKLSATSTPMEIVTFLNDLYCLFDSIISHYNVYKVETIGDAYMVVSGLPIPHQQHCSEVASMALEMLEAIKTFRIRHRPNDMLQLRIGIHTGPVVAGVVGTKMPRYCLFGDTVNTASRMESNGEALRIHISPECRDNLAETGQYVIEERGTVFLKGKGDVKTYWLCGHVDGPRFRSDHNAFHYVDSPWIQKDTKGTIPLFDSGPLNGQSNEPNLAKLYKRNLTGAAGVNTSFSRLKSTYSSSCSTFRTNNNHISSPKPSKKNWTFRILSNQSKSRSNSANQPDPESNHLPMKENKKKETCQNPPKSIVKSTSYNMIEYFNTHGSMINNNNSQNVVTNSDPDSNLIPIPKRTFEPLILESNINDPSEKQQEENEEDESKEDEPLLLLKKFGRKHKNSVRKSSLPEVDEDSDKREEPIHLKEQESKTKPNGIVISIDDGDDDDVKLPFEDDHAKGFGEMEDNLLNNHHHHHQHHTNNEMLNSHFR